MHNFLMYLLQSAGCITVLFLVFKVLLERQASFTFNRFFLLGSVFFSVVVPALHFSLAGNQPDRVLAKALPVYQLPEVTLKAAENFLPGNFLLLVYMMGAAIFLFRLLHQLFQLYRLKSKAVITEKHPGFTLVFLKELVSPFTFGSTIFLTRSASADPQQAVIVAHELVHVRQRHTLDLLLVEALKIMQWFNPVIWFFQHSLRQQHEFLADREAIRATAGFSDYARQILNQALGTNQFTLTHRFSSSQLKNRLAMLNQTTTFRRIFFRALLTLPVSVILFYAVACETASNDIPPVASQKVTSSANSEKVSDFADEMPVFKGGMDALYQYLAENLKGSATGKIPEGKVVASFVVSPKGEITDIEILKSLGEPFDSEVRKVLAAMPAWIPAKTAGRPVAMKMVIPVTFKGKNPFPLNPGIGC